MKTPHQIAETANQIYAFLTENGEGKVTRCQLLELAARIHGHRDLHEAQSASDTPLNTKVQKATTIKTEVFATFTLLVADQLKRGIITTEAVQAADFVLPIELKWITEKIISASHREGAELHKTLRKLGFPNFICASYRQAYVSVAHDELTSFAQHLYLVAKSIDTFELCPTTS